MLHCRSTERLVNVALSEVYLYLEQSGNGICCHAPVLVRNMVFKVNIA